MVKEGDIIDIPKGAFKGQKAVVKQLSSAEILVEINLFGRNTTVPLSYSDLGLNYTPSYFSFKSLLSEFDALYKEKAPLRYACLNEGIGNEDFLSRTVFQSITHVPEDFIELLKWKNGMDNSPEGWTSEFEDDAWYEIIPFNEVDHFMSVESIEGTIKMWEDILAAAKEKNQLCYWKKGFIPFLMIQHFGLVVIDTVGYFDGQPGQILSFDYKCANGYSIIHENINKWFETQLTLLKKGLMFSPQDFIASSKVEKEINYYYTSKFPSELPLDN